MDFLRQFDLNYKFGPAYGKKKIPCLVVKFANKMSYEMKGVPRLQRWEWAKRHELDPPDDVKKLVEAHANDPEYEQG